MPKICSYEYFKTIIWYVKLSQYNQPNISVKLLTPLVYCATILGQKLIGYCSSGMVQSYHILLFFLIRYFILLIISKIYLQSQNIIFPCVCTLPDQYSFSPPNIKTWCSMKNNSGLFYCSGCALIFKRPLQVRYPLVKLFNSQLYGFYTQDMLRL